MSRNRNRNTWINHKPEETVEKTVEEIVEETVEETVEGPATEETLVENIEPRIETHVPEVTEEVVGVISGCRKLNVRSEPDINSAVICIVDEKTQVIIDEQESTEDFYKVYIPINISGFCVKKFVSKK